MTDFGKRLKGARKSQGLTQEQLARRLKVYPITISHYEQNKGVRQLLKLVELCQVLNVTPNSLLGFKERRKNNDTP